MKSFTSLIQETKTKNSVESHEEREKRLWKKWFMNGYCPDFALALQKVFGYRRIGVVMNSENQFVHMFCIKGSKIIDANGVRTTDEMLNDFRNRSSLTIITEPKIVKKIFKSLIIERPWLVNERNQEKKAIVNLIDKYKKEYQV